MEDSFDPATSSLLCLENNNTCFDDFERSAADGSGIMPSWDQKNFNFNDQHLSVDNHGSEPQFMGFLVQSVEVFGLMVERERDHLPRGDYLMRLRSGDMELDVVRKKALDWIWKAHAYYGFGPSSFCLSVNYLDRFLSVYESPINKSWAVQLLAVACFSVAAKMEESKVPPIIDLQVEEPKFVFEATTIQRMELILLSTLKWKMQALNPCSFIDHFLSKISGEQHPAQTSISRSIELILSVTKCVDFLEFRPSEIAAAVAISVSMESQSKELDKALNCAGIVERDRVSKCLDMIKDLSLIKVSANSAADNSAPFVPPQSPVDVLDATCLSYKSDELTVRPDYSRSAKRLKTVGPDYSRSAKRLKTDGRSGGTFKS